MVGLHRGKRGSIPGLPFSRRTLDHSATWAVCRQACCTRSWELVISVQRPANRYGLSQGDRKWESAGQGRGGEGGEGGGGGRGGELFVGCLTSQQHASVYRLVGPVARRPPRERKIPGSNPACAGNFSGSSHTSDLKIGTPVATLPGAWRYRVSTGTGRPGVSILGLGEVERWICNFYLSVAARKIV